MNDKPTKKKATSKTKDGPAFVEHEIPHFSQVVADATMIGGAKVARIPVPMASPKYDPKKKVALKTPAILRPFVQGLLDTRLINPIFVTVNGPTGKREGEAPEILLYLSKKQGVRERDLFKVFEFVALLFIPILPRLRFTFFKGLVSVAKTPLRTHILSIAPKDEDLSLDIKRQLLVLAAQLLREIIKEGPRMDFEYPTPDNPLQWDESEIIRIKITAVLLCGEAIERDKRRQKRTK